MLEIIADIVKSERDEGLVKQGYYLDPVPLPDNEEGRLLMTRIESPSQPGMFRPLGVAFVRREIEEQSVIVIIGVFVGEEGPVKQPPKQRKPRK